jgi:L-threonine-O-3-phosphate decarboxylase
MAGCPASSIQDFSASINPWGPPASAIAAIQETLSQLKFYPDPNYSKLKLALAQYYHLESDYILPGNGSAELLTWAAWELAQQKLTYLITPAFGDYWRALRAFGAKIETYCLLPFLNLSKKGDLPIIPTGDNQSNLDRLFNNPPANSGLLLNNPHNPTGKLWTREEILSCLDKFALVVIDEAFMDFLPPNQEQSLISLIREFPNLVILRSLTKFYSLPGLRIGYAIAHPERLQRWQKWRDPWSVNILAAAAAEVIIRDRSFQEQTWAWLPVAREELFQGLACIPQLQPLASAANFLLVHTTISSQQLQEKLLKKHHILIRDCLSFPELGDRYFRVAVRSQADNQKLLQALLSLLRYSF